MEFLKAAETHSLKFDAFLAGYISKYGNSRNGNLSYLPKTTWEEIIILMAQMVTFSLLTRFGYFIFY